MSLSIREITKQDTLFLKGLAICGMLMWHVFYCQNPQGIVYSPFVRYIGAIGDVCVSIFLFISGYGMIIGYAKNESNPIAFVFNRLLKFYSNFWFVFLLIVLYGTFVMNQPIRTDGVLLHRVLQYVKEFLAIRGQKSYNDSWWYFSLIITFYLIFPVLYWGIKKVPWIVVWLALFLGAFYTKITYQDIHLYAPIFIIGMLWAMHGDKLPLLAKKCYVILFMLAMLIVPLIIMSLMFEDLSVCTKGIFLYALLTIVQVCFVLIFQNKSNILEQTFCYLGKYATNIYIIHLLLSKYWFPAVFYAIKSPWLLFLVLLLVSLILSIFIQYIKRHSGYDDIFTSFRTIFVNKVANFRVGDFL